LTLCRVCFVVMLSFFDALFQWSDSGRIGIVTEKGYYVAGELVKGHIYASIDRPIQASAVILQITGYESATWEEELSKWVDDPDAPMPAHQPGQPPPTRPQKQVFYYEYHQGGTEFFNQRFVISELNGAVLAPGQYQFPFQYQLPKGVPGVFFEQRRRHQSRRGPRGAFPWDGGKMVSTDGYHTSYDEKTAGAYRHDHSSDYRCFYGNWRDDVAMEAKVAYMFHATLDVSGAFARDLFATQPLIVHESLDMVKPAADQRTQNIYVCCCFSQGPATVRAFFDKNAYALGETAVVTAEIQNASKKDIRSMKISLIRTLRLRSAGGRTETYVNKMLEASYEGVLAGTNKTMPMNITFDPTKLIDQSVPFTPTSNGAYVNCTYSFNVKCDVANASDVNLIMPVILYVPQPAKWGISLDKTTG